MPRTEAVVVVCPYCGESVELHLEADLTGEMVRDCEVCCNPWRLRLERSRAGLEVLISTLDD